MKSEKAVPLDLITFSGFNRQQEVMRPRDLVASAPASCQSELGYSLQIEHERTLRLEQENAIGRSFVRRADQPLTSIASEAPLAGLAGVTRLGRVAESDALAEIRGQAFRVARRLVAAEIGSAFQGPPFIDLVKNLVEQDRLVSARDLLTLAARTVPLNPQILVWARVLAPPRIAVSGKTDSDRNREYRWILENGSSYRGQWIAVDGDRLVASARSLRDLLMQLRGLGITQRPLIHHVD